MTQGYGGRVLITISGIVQGVGFRPFVYNLARGLGVRGWVSNTSQGVVIDAEADDERVHQFIARIPADKPPHSRIERLEWQRLQPVGYDSFEIHHSDNAGAKTALILPDLCTCPECLRDIFDPSNRRYGYPFTNCTHCGPRFTIIEALPYDRPNTTMRHFTMCPACQKEYDDPLDRRFHAQPNACPVCGPQLAFWSLEGETLAKRKDALQMAEDMLRLGQILAVKGLGGFHLMCDARNEASVALLRARKGREEKPFALMVPSLSLAESHCHVGELERALLQSPEAPIVLLLRQGGGDIAPQVAPDNPYLAIMLPATPLHHLLMAHLGFPVVATSGNLSGEPLCTEEDEALARLGRIADGFLVHNRPIARHADDSIVRVAAGRQQVLRRARGYVPLPVEMAVETPPLVATGAHLKNTMAMATGKRVFVSQHIGDLDTAQAVSTLERVTGDFKSLYAVQPVAAACDLHPDYHSTGFAESMGLPVIRVQHHYAHALACMAEHELEGTVLAVVWDGTGYGDDGTIWGGEFLRIDEHGFTRFARLAPFALPGGDQAVREPRRTALSLLYELYGDAAFDIDLPVIRSFTPTERALLKQVLRQRLNALQTSSAGRLFDGVAALLGLRERCSFEGQAAMQLEFAALGCNCDRCYPFLVTDDTTSAGDSGRNIEWKPVVEAILRDLGDGITRQTIAAQFHNTMSAMITAIAQLAGEDRVVLSGGCFQNQRLLEQTVQRLVAEGFHPYWHQRVPTNDGGIALGQIVAASRELTGCV